MLTTVLVTGGNKGIGLETSRLFQKLGYKVFVVARDFYGGSLQPGQVIAQYACSGGTDLFVLSRQIRGDAGGHLVPVCGPYAALPYRKLGRACRYVERVVVRFVEELAGE